MKIKLERRLITLAIFTIITLLFTTKVKASSAHLTIDKAEVKVGEEVTIGVSINAATWNLSITGNGISDDSIVGYEENGNNKVTSKYYKLDTSSAGTYTIYLKGDITDESESTQKINQSVTIKVVEKTGGSEGTSSGTSSGGSSSGTNTNSGSSKPAEPKFTDVSKTVYSTGDINLRSSWSTSSNATKISKGTELRLTGTSTETVNGYVWYRVTYNGQIKYVARNLVTETKPDEEKEEEKSNNVNLKKIEITGVDLSPAFSSDITEYTAKISNYTEKELNITAEAENEKAKVKIEGDKDIKIGENTITITVTAEDETTKVYTIKLTNEQTDAFGLSSLKIKDVELKNFQTDKFEYDVSFSDLDKLEIEAIANEEGATIEIIGNENLVEGENIITIVVTSKDGNKIATYQIKANKLVTLTQNESKELNIVNLALSGLIALIVLIIIILLIIKYVNHKENIEEIVEEDFGHMEEQISDETQNTQDNYENMQSTNNSIEVQQEKNESSYEDKSNKYSVDDLFRNHEDFEDDEEIGQKRRGKGKHSK